MNRPLPPDREILVAPLGAKNAVAVPLRPSKPTAPKQAQVERPRAKANPWQQAEAYAAMPFATRAALFEVNRPLAEELRAAWLTHSR